MEKKYSYFANEKLRIIKNSKYNDIVILDLLEDIYCEYIQNQD